MTAPVRTCPEHGPFESEGDREACPICDDRGTESLSGRRRRQLSTFVSGALRHFPEDAGLDLDERGWTPYGDLVSAIERQYDWASERHLEAVIETDPKGRFERTGVAEEGGHGDNEDGGDDDRVRAAYGHSVDVSLEPTDGPVPDELYHGTAPTNLRSIRTEGLRPMSRQQVHLSESHEAARGVGRRHASDPVVLVVDAASMLADGRRITKRGRETYTTDEVPPAYLSTND
ncbi:RNA 2'-phosphotransferase [Natrarchaeobius chitinivorans]|uniref:Probable RNA 2'-phosphotransferase n=1 Tax=Natrarchaeobius chitinivorans TaxID=1679083 RepID=A0A3N6P5P3_NATCH|nr:RNA 2'-phosphotransferase [Natrarchaeobius chitinivorans]RQG90955.1 RNA 2'-phosphotransferase [Natrarchaeobius chitinivorans]